MTDKRQGLIQQALNKVAQTAQRIFPGAQQEFAKTHWGRTLSSPAVQSFGKSLTNTVQQGVPSAYRILTPQSTQITLGKINPALGPKLKARDQVKDAFNTVKLGATAVGLPQLGLGTALTSTALGGAFNKFGGGSFFEGAGQGLGSAGTIAGIGKLTNPLINKTASQITKGIASPMKQFAANRVATGALNIPEGMIMQGATSGIPYSLGDAAIDFGLGAAGGQTLTGQKGQIKKVGRSVVPVKDAVRQVQENLDHMVDILKRYDLQLGDMAPVRGVNKADLDLYPDAIKMWKNIYGAHIKPPRDLGQVVGELREAFNGVRTQMRMEQEGISLGLRDTNAVNAGLYDTVKGKYYRFETEGTENAQVRFFSRNKDYADEYGLVRKENGKKGRLIVENVELKKPLIVNATERQFSDPSFEKGFIDQAIREGNDGVVFRSGDDEFVAKINRDIIEKSGGGIGRRWKQEAGASPNTTMPVNLRSNLAGANPVPGTNPRVAQPTTQTAGLYDTGKMTTTEKGLLEEATKRGYKDKNPFANIEDVRRDLYEQNDKFRTFTKQILDKYKNIRVQGKQSIKELMTKDEVATWDKLSKEADDAFDLLQGKSRVAQPTKADVTDLPDEAMGFVARSQPVSSDAIKTKQGKIKIQGYPTQTEIKNRAEINAGNPDLYTQRSAKLEQVYGKPEGVSPITGRYQEGLTSDEAFNQLRAQEFGKLRLSTRPEQKIQQSVRIQATSPRLSPEGFSQSKQTARPIIDSQGQKVDTSFDGIVNSSGFDVKKKVGILDIFRTPDRVLSKMGLRKEAYDLRRAHDSYVRELPGEIDKITQWSKQVPKASNEKIFRYLDGQGGKLDDNELRVAKEVRGYLEGWADRLGLPKEGRIASYITHIFDKEQFTKEMDPDLAKIIRERVAGSVYDPFLEKRLGALGYKQDTWAALDAYVKRATRKANLDPVLKVISQKSENFEESQFDYVKKYIAGVNMQPTKLDNMIDNTIKQLIGYKLGGRPVTAITRTMRQAGFRGALGLNVGSAVRNLTQGANTYAKLGEKHTIIGYTRLLKHLATNDFKELEETGILRNDFVQDRAINATKKFWEKTDKGLFALFELAEKINRGSAYYGAKSKALGKGMSEEQAVDYAKGIVRDTQFTFGSVDTPALLQSDIAKTFGQFQSYNMKQAEFLGEMIKNKEFAGLARYTLSSLAVVFTLGNFIGLDPEDIIPFSGVVSGESKLGQTPAINAILKTKEALIDDKDQYGNDLTIKDRVKTATDAIIPIIPGGVQIKKTIQGLEAANQGYSESKTGRVQYAIDQSAGNKIRAGLFGKNNLPEAQEYFDSKSSVLGEKQSEFLKNSVDKLGTYKTFLENRNKEEGAKSGDSAGQTSGNTFQYMKDGDIKEIDLSFQPTPPKMTGLEELDKKARSKFYGEISAKQNDIYELYEQKQISAEDAEKQLKTLDGLRSLYKSTKAKKGRKVSLKKVKMPSSKAIKLSSPKLAKIKLKTSKPKKFKIGKSTKIS